MSALLRRENPRTPLFTEKPVTFESSVEWSAKIRNDGGYQFRKNVFWMILAFVITLIIIIWLVLNYMNSDDKALPDSSSESNESNDSGGSSDNKKIIDEMVSDNSSIAPDSGRNYRVMRAHRSPKLDRPKNFVSPLPDRLNG